MRVGHQLKIRFVIFAYYELTYSQHRLITQSITSFTQQETRRIGNYF